MRECRTDRDIVLVGTVDMDRSQRAMLDQVADRVTALVFAPDEQMAEFDEHGCLAGRALGAKCRWRSSGSRSRWSTDRPSRPTPC